MPEHVIASRTVPAPWTKDHRALITAIQEGAGHDPATAVPAWDEIDVLTEDVEGMGHSVSTRRRPVLEPGPIPPTAEVRRKEVLRRRRAALDAMPPEKRAVAEQRWTEIDHARDTLSSRKDSDRDD